MLSATKRVLLVAHDRGGVNLLAPLLSHWHRNVPRIEAAFLSTPVIQYEMASIADGCYPPSAARRKSHGVSPDLLNGIKAVQLDGTGDAFVGRSAWTFTDDDLLRILNGSHWDLVLTGTSALSNMEKSVWRVCRELSIPCAALCDMWTEYELRLTANGGELLVDHLLVIDERMDREVKEAFDAPPRTKIVGSPHFDQLLENRQRPQAHRQFVRFISEPIAALFPKAGIHEFYAAEMVIDALERVGLASSLLLRPHPQDDSEGWRRFAYDYRANGVALDDEPSWACPLSTKAAIGLSSMMLIELALAGIPVASLQLPGSDSSYYCLHETEFGIAVVRSAQDLAEWIVTLPPPHVSQEFIDQHLHAVTRITDLILSDQLLS